MLILCCVQCGGLAGVTTSATGGDATDDTGGSSTDGGSSSGVDALSDSETDLYDSGPIDLPVTIAKLDSIGVQEITAEYSETGIPQVTRALSQTATGSGYTVTVSAGGVKDPDTTPKVLALNITTDETEVIDVEADGSASFTIASSESDVIAVAPMTDGEDNIAPPIYVSVNNGVVAKFYTNADTLAIEQNILSRDDYLYFSYTADDGSGPMQTLFRRNLDGSAIETVAEQVEGYPIQYVSVRDDVAVMITGIGEVLSTTGTAIAALVADSWTPYATLDWSDPVQLFDLGEVPRIGDVLGSEGNQILKAYQNADGGVFITRSRQANSPDLNSDLLIYVDPDSGNATTLIDKDDYEEALFDEASEDKIYVVLRRSTAESYFIYRLDLSQGANAWAARESLDYMIGTVTAGQGVYLRAIDLSENGYGAFSVIDGAGGVRFYLANSNQSPTLIFDNTNPAQRQGFSSQFVRVSPSATASSGYLIFCTTGTEFFSVYPLGSGGTTFYKVHNELIGYNCELPFYIDEYNQLLFYSWLDPDSGNPEQVTIIDIDTLDIANLPVHE